MEFKVIAKSPIFQAHPQSNQILERLRSLKTKNRLSLALMALGALGGPYVSIALLDQGPFLAQKILTFLAPALVFLGFVFFMKAAHLSGEIRREAERSLSRLSFAMNVSSEKLVTLPREVIEANGRLRLIGQGIEWVDFEKKTRAFSFHSSCPTDLEELVKDFFREELEKRVEKISELYDALLEYELTAPGGYGWVFDKARGQMRSISI